MKFLNRLILLFATLTTALALSAQTPMEIMRKVSSIADGTSGVSGNFSLRGPGGVVRGSFKFDGTRSVIDVPSAATSWFDGKNLWSLNKNTKEITVTLPDQSELAEANPLLFLRNYSSNFNVSFSKRKVAGKHIIMLRPKRAMQDVKWVEAVIGSSSGLPEYITVCDTRGQRSLMSLSHIKTNCKFKAADFSFPQNRYKGYEIIDLR